MYAGRTKKTPQRPVESVKARVQRLALAPLAEARSKMFFIDVRLIKKPTGVVCSRNLYPGHVVELEECISARGEEFPVKTIYVALGNVSSYFYFFV